eukprot:168137-Chlamydomonas_euryale.AAC.10
MPLASWLVDCRPATSPGIASRSCSDARHVAHAGDGRLAQGCSRFLNGVTVTTKKQMRLLFIKSH